MADIDTLRAALHAALGNVDDIVIDDREVALSLLDFAAFITKRERAAAERMREQRDEARRAAIGYALVGCDEGVFEREECEDVNGWMREHGVLSLADVLEGLPASAGKPEEPGDD